MTGRGGQASIGCMQCHVTFSHGAKLGYIPGGLLILSRTDELSPSRVSWTRERRVDRLPASACDPGETAGPSLPLRSSRDGKPEAGVLSAAYPTQAQRQGLTPTSCHAVLERSACAPFIKERRRECINATSAGNRTKWGTPTFVAGAGGRVIAPLTCHRQDGSAG